MPRPPSADSVLRHFKEQEKELRTPIGTEIFIPNLSGDLSKGTVRDTPTANLDPVNKAYVDGQIGAHTHALTAGATDVTATAAEVNVVDGFTGTTANMNTLVNDSMADALHRHSELSASDGTPDAIVIINASGNVGIGIANPTNVLDINNAGQALLRLYSTGTNQAEVTMKTASHTSYFGAYNGSFAFYANSGATASFVINAGAPGISQSRGKFQVFRTTGATFGTELNEASGNCLRLIYNDSSNAAPTNKVDFVVSATGDLTVTPSGGDVSFGSANIATTGDVKGATFHVGATAGVSGTFTTVDLKTVTVTNGIITSIV